MFFFGVWSEKLNFYSSLKMHAGTFKLPSFFLLFFAWNYMVSWFIHVFVVSQPLIVDVNLCKFVLV